MTPPAEFTELIRRVRAGDAEAARLLVERYEPAVRRAVRFRLTSARLRSALDSADICQSVFGSFFVRAAIGAFDLERPEQLVGLLVSIARNKLVTQVRKQGIRAPEAGNALTPVPDQDSIPAATPSPSEAAATGDLLAAVRSRLTPDERRLAELRLQGYQWQEIAVLLGERAESLRKRFSRAVSRVAQDLGLDGEQS